MDEEEVLQARDLRVQKQIRDELASLDSDILALQEELDSKKSQKGKIIRATDREEWWKLRGLLSADDIESLCGISPVNLLGD